VTLADYAAQVQALLARARELEEQILRENWQTPQDRDAAGLLVVRLELMRRTLSARPSGENDQAGAGGD
jgi:hypothetical protein